MMDESDCMVTCPYNKSHVLYKSRLQTHLKKCSYANTHPQKNVDPLNMKICQFNTNHHVPAAELAAHHASCPDLGILTRFLTPCAAKGSAIPYKEIKLPPSEENWDDEADSCTYDPSEHATSLLILRTAQGVPKAERKSFRLKERERINRIREEEEALVKENRVATKPQPVTVVEKHAFTEQALRHPKLGQLGMGRGRKVATNPALMGDDNFAVQGIGRAYTLKGMSNAMPNLPPMRSKAVNADSIAATAGSSSASTFSSGTSRPSSENSGVDEAGFVEQRSKKKKKKKKGPSSGTPPGSVPSGNNPLTTPGSAATFAFPGLPGKGRGRIRKN